MKKATQSAPCPLCGGERKPATKASRASVRRRAGVLLKPPTDVADSVVAESSDDKTANDFAAVLVKAQRNDFEYK